jgi:hypothetical protein
MPKNNKCVEDQGCQMLYFQTKNRNLGKFCSFAMEEGGVFYGRLVYLTAIWYFLGHLVYFFPFWYFVFRKIWQPC